MIDQHLRLFMEMGSLAGLAMWLSLGVYDNVRHPRLNRQSVEQVLRMDLVKQEDEALYRDMSYRRIDNPLVAARLFGVIVWAEAAVTALMWLAASFLFLAALDIMATSYAVSIAAVAVMGFIGIWLGFLIGGQWFCYWVGMQKAQHTHLLLMLWGFANLVLLAI